MSDEPVENDTPRARKGSVVAGPVITRRVALRALGVSVAGVHLASLQGCQSSLDPGAADAGSQRDASPGAEDGAAGDANGTSDGSPMSDANVDADAGGDEWASGGTAAMGDPASYPDPFETDAPATCALTCSMTAGPCYDAAAPAREDISEGKTGLPMRLGLRVLDEDCKPVAGASVDVWHCDAEGVYSSAAVASPSFCTGGDPVALAAQWFRGHLATDTSGVVWFSTCVPGWYPGRALHVHVTVRRTETAGQEEFLTTQLLFDDALAQQVCGQHPDYAARGVPDVLNGTDRVLPAGDLSPFMLSTQRAEDGALLAHKTLIVQPVANAAGC